MPPIRIDEPTVALVLGNTEKTVLIAPGDYQGERWIHSNFEQETVRLISAEGTSCTFEREARLYRRAHNTETGEEHDSEFPITLAELLEGAKIVFGSDSLDKLIFYARI